MGIQTFGYSFEVSLLKPPRVLITCIALVLLTEIVSSPLFTFDPELKTLL